MYSEFVSKKQSADFELLLVLIRADLTPERIRRAGELVEIGGVDWERILRLAENHRVLPVLYANIKKAGLLPVLPEAVQSNFSRQYLNIVAYNLRICKKLMAVLARFEQRGIPAVLYKGPLLSQCLYGDSALRYYQDVDVLVPEDQVVSARDALLESRLFPSVKWLSGKRFVQVLKYARECHFLDAAEELQIDLHWQVSVPYRQAFDYEFCKERLQKISFDGRDILSLSAEDMLLCLCLNGAHDIWNHLEKVLCVAEWIGQHPALDWQLTLKLAGLLHCRRRLLLGLFLARDVFGITLPVEIVDNIKKDKTIRKIVQRIYTDLFDGNHQTKGIEGRIAELPYYLKIREHPGDKFHYLLRRIFIPTQKDWEKHSRDSRFSGFYFLFRPFGLLVELVKTFRH